MLITANLAMTGVDGEEVVVVVVGVAIVAVGEADTRPIGRRIIQMSIAEHDRLGLGVGALENGASCSHADGIISARYVLGLGYLNLHHATFFSVRSFFVFLWNISYADGKSDLCS